MIRLALGTASVLGLVKTKLDVPLGVAHFMTSGKCSFDCDFCSQARTSSAGNKNLSRVTWPLFSWKEVLQALKNYYDKQAICQKSLCLPELVQAGRQNHQQLQKVSPYGVFKRICLQTTHNKNTWQDIKTFVKNIRSVSNVPLSISYRPKNIKEIQQLLDLGFQKIGLALDLVNPRDFETIKKQQHETFIELIQQAALSFPGHISTHFIIGFSETEKDVVELLLKLRDWKVTVGLFALTPIRGTKLARCQPPDIKKYRRIQLAQWLITHHQEKKIVYNASEEINDFGYSIKKLKKMLRATTVFQTSGCPGCNRPYYTERPGQILYNYPRPLTSHEFQDIMNNLW